MKRLKIENSINNHFIGCWNIDHDLMIDNIVEFFDSHPKLQTSGKLSGGRIDRNIKDSIDISIEPKLIVENNDFKIFKDYFDQLMTCYIDYQKQFEALNFFQQVHLGTFNLQKYPIGGHFKNPHFERSSLATSHRLFAWMTYLNDVPNGGGETKFEYFGIKVKPEKGKTLIWPAEWTHLHCGLPTKKDEKYIATGWFHLPDREDL